MCAKITGLINRDTDLSNQNTENPYFVWGGIFDGDGYKNDFINSSKGTLLGGENVEVIGHIVLQNAVIVFIIQDGDSKIIIFKENVSEWESGGTVILSDENFATGLNFSNLHQIKGCFFVNYKGETVIIFTDFYNPIRIVNIDTNYNDLFTQGLYDINKLTFFSNIKIPLAEIYVSDNGFNLKTGAWYVFFQYVREDNSVTQTLCLNSTIYLIKDGYKQYINTFGNKNNEFSQQGIKVKLTNLDTTYNKLNLIFYNISTNQGFIKRNFDYIDSLNYIFKNTNNVEIITIEEILKQIAVYNTARTLNLKSDAFLLGNLKKKNINLKIQKYVNNFKLKWKCELVDLKEKEYNNVLQTNDKFYSNNGKSFMPFEVYAHYIQFLLKSGEYTDWYILIGRPKRVVHRLMFGTLTPTYIQYLQNEDELASELSPKLFVDNNTKYFQIADTSTTDINGSNTGFENTGEFGYWENQNEYYEDYFDTEDLQIWDSGGNTGQTITGKVRHFRYPSIKSLQDTTYSDNIDFLLNESCKIYPVLENFYLPAEILNEIAGYRLGFAERNVSDSLIFAQDVCLFDGRYEADGTANSLKRNIYSTGYNGDYLGDNEQGRLFNPTLNGLNSNVGNFNDINCNGKVKFYSPDILLDKLNVNNIKFIKIEAILAYFPRTSYFQSVSQVDNQDYQNPIFNSVVDYYDFHYKILSDFVTGRKTGNINDVSPSGQNIINNSKKESESLNIRRRWNGVDIDILNSFYYGLLTNSYGNYSFEWLIRVPFEKEYVPNSVVYDKTFVGQNEIYNFTIHNFKGSEHLACYFDTSNNRGVNPDDTDYNNISLANQFNSFNAPNLWVAEAVGGRHQSYTYLVSLCNLIEDIYKNFNQQKVIGMNVIPIDQINNTLIKNLGGDVFVSDVSTYIKGKLLIPIDDGDANTTVSSIMRYVAHTRHNWNYRHSESDSNLTLKSSFDNFYPKGSMVLGANNFLNKLADDGGSLNVGINVPKITYNKDFSELTDFNGSTSSIYDKNKIIQNEFRYRVAYSKNNNETNKILSLREFLINDYKDFSKSKGEIINIENDGVEIYIQSLYTTYYTRSSQDLETNSIKINLTSGIIFQPEPIELEYNNLGSVGTQHQFGNLMTKYGLFSIDSINGKINLITNGKVNTISDIGLKNFFKEHLILYDGLNQITDKTNKNDKKNNTDESGLSIFSLSLDEYNERLFVLYQPLNMFSPLDLQSEYGFRISFNLKNNKFGWSSFHKYENYLQTFNTRNNCYFIIENEEGIKSLKFVFDNGKTELPEGDEEIVYGEDFAIDLVFGTKVTKENVLSSPSKNDKEVFLSFNWKSESSRYALSKSKGDTNKTDSTFTHAFVRTDRQMSVETPLVILGTSKNVLFYKNNYHFNSFRDIVINNLANTPLMFPVGKGYLQNLFALDLVKNYKEKRRISNNFAILRLSFKIGNVFNNPTFIKITEADTNSQEFYR